MLNIAPQSHPPFEGYREDNRLVIRWPLRKAISSQLALSSFELLSLKPPISEEDGTSNEDVGLSNGLNRYMDAWGRAI